MTPEQRLAKAQELLSQMRAVKSTLEGMAEKEANDITELAMKLDPDLFDSEPKYKKE